MAIVDSETSCVMHVDSKAHTSENAKKQIETIQCVVSGSMPVTEDEAQNHFRDFDSQQTSSGISNVHVVVNDFHGERKVCNISDDSLSVNDLDQCEKSLQETLTERDYLDDDDDDSDWEPFQKHLVMKKWYCTNCTMVNFEDVDYCDACGEHKESEIFSNAGLIFHDAQKRPEIPSENMGIYQEEAKHSEFCTLTSNGINICTAVGFDERMLLHSEASMKSHPHPERPDRLRAIASRLAAAGIYPGKCFPIPAREVTNEELQMIHAEDLIEAVELTRSMPCSYFTSDTYANPHSASAARIAAGLCADLATAIMSEKAKNGFALVRPPGHHAGIKQPMGFCLHNNAAVAALSAQAAGAKRVLIVDWDVHHGNGTQEIFEGNKTVLYISLHRHEGGLFYPGTGAAEEVGVMGAEGYCVNIPWKCAGVGDNDYIFAFQHIVLPIASKFAPDFTIVSAGFDAARGDPLGRCDVTPAGYAQMTHMLGNLSDGKLLVILEGGYNLHSISSSSVAVINVLLGETPTDNVDNVIPSRAGILTALEVLKIQMKFWPNLESNYLHIQSNWEVLRSQHKEKRAKRRRVMVPTWWKWGSKRWLYNLFWGEGGLTVHHQSRRP